MFHGNNCEIAKTFCLIFALGGSSDNPVPKTVSPSAGRVHVRTPRTHLTTLLLNLNMIYKDLLSPPCYHITLQKFDKHIKLLQ